MQEEEYEVGVQQPAVELLQLRRSSQKLQLRHPESWFGGIISPADGPNCSVIRTYIYKAPADHFLCIRLPPSMRFSFVAEVYFLSAG